MASRSVAAYRGWEKRRERDEAVAVDIDIGLRPLWEALGRPRNAEAFGEYAETDEGQRAALAAIQTAADAKLEQLIAEREAAPRRRKAG